MIETTEHGRHAFILRCWYEETGGIRTRLVDVVTGVGYPTAHLSDLPPLIERLMARSQDLSEEVQENSEQCRK